jgi:mRNA interferase RelE/StbE
MLYPAFDQYKIVFSKTAGKFLDTLDKETKQKILKKIKAMQSGATNLDIKKLKSRYTLYRLRVGNFRIIYTIKYECKIIYIVVIGFRKNIYQQAFFA